MILYGLLHVAHAEQTRSQDCHTMLRAAGYTTSQSSELELLANVGAK